MAISYTWDCKKHDRYPTHNRKNNVVHTVHWQLTAVDGSNNDAEGNPQSAYAYGTQSLDTTDLSKFVDWSSLTSANLQAWVEAAMGAEAITALKANLDAQIAEKVTPTSEFKTLSS